jgi:hypothetical protein
MHQGGDHALRQPQVSDEQGQPISGASAAARNGLPPLPWSLKAAGPVLVTLHPVRMEAARRLVPSAFRLVPIFPGYTLGGLFLARYGPGSDLRYRELIVAGATILHDSRPAPWVTHVFVDSDASRWGGQVLLGAPKFLAEFEELRRGAVSRVEILDEDGWICSIRYRRRLRLGSGRLRLDAAHQEVGATPASSVRLHGNCVEGRLGLAGATVRFPAGGRLHRTGMVQRSIAFTVDEARLLLGGAGGKNVALSF